MRRIAGYHFGWHDEHGRPVEAGGGKSVHPALVLLAARAVGGSAEEAVPAACAAELVLVRTHQCLPPVHTDVRP